MHLNFTISRLSGTFYTALTVSFASQNRHANDSYSGNEIINGKKLIEDASGNLVVQTESRHSPCQLLLPSEGVLSSVQAATKGAKPEATASVILQGPSGKAEYQMRLSTLVEEDEGMIGSSTYYEGWEVIEEGTRLWLRYKDPTRASHWVAAREGQDEDGRALWSPWWFSPNPANMDDLSEYVSIDIQLVPADQEEVESRDDL